MTAPRDPEIDPRHDVASLFGAPENDTESESARDLAELFGPLLDEEEPLETDDSAGREHLAALFGDRSTSTTAPAESEPDFSWDPEQIGGSASSAGGASSAEVSSSE